jgi:RNA 3'-terminal phosphate cyclase (ATP)
MIEIDGSQGEGGGQIVRSALTLALVTGRSLKLINIRAGRKKPGLRAQHLKAVEAAVALSEAKVEGASFGSRSLIFHPERIKPGNYRFDIGTAGSTSLVLQTIFIPLSLSDTPSVVTVTGGTHVKWSPAYHYLDLHWLRYMGEIGFRADLTLELAGYYPQGGGIVRASIQPCSDLMPLDIKQRGSLKIVRGLSAISNLPTSIADRQRYQALQKLEGLDCPVEIEVIHLSSRWKGTMLLLLAVFENSQACYVGLGERGKPAERVADDASQALLTFMQTDALIDEYLADQLLLPLAFASGPSTYQTPKVTPHLSTNAAVIRSFEVAEIDIQGEMGHSGSIRIVPITQ